MRVLSDRVAPEPAEERVATDGLPARPEHADPLGGVVVRRHVGERQEPALRHPFHEQLLERSRRQEEEGDGCHGSPDDDGTAPRVAELDDGNQEEQAHELGPGTIHEECGNGHHVGGGARHPGWGRGGDEHREDKVDESVPLVVHRPGLVPNEVEGRPQERTVRRVPEGEGRHEQE